MNFENLLAKMKQIDECGDMPKAAKPSLADGDDILTTECGDMPMPGALAHPPKQSDSVTMNVSMNGSGAGGIKDLMAILKNIEQGGSTHGGDSHDDVLVGMDETQPDGGFGSTNNDKDTTTLDINAITGSGDDIHSNKGDHNDDRYSGFAPVASPVSEALVKRLAEMYAEIKGEDADIKEGEKKEPEGSHSSKRFETDAQRVARMAKEKKQAEKKKETEEE